MYEVKKRWRVGYVMLPCFTIRELTGSDTPELTCSSAMQWIFIHFFAPFWTGKVWWKGEYEE